MSSEQLESKANKKTSKQSPTKRNARTARVASTARTATTARRQRRRINFGDITFSESDLSFEDEAPVARPARSVHDPNTIVLDCDDEFIGGPSVNFTRNVAAAAAVSAEESRELKVTVKINGKIDHYQMNAVSYLICIF